ncbi:hypothetical protein PVAP13_2NG263703 [Panicum virgatum]|uniref:ATP-dependent DNA helicase n=1 Tax=Panicum virgatum TaxID=38727 RepID=A0A8T0VIU0_PANVG|nr:hypothetical protein PVAP13_2NG263703 [Panicum virgatum]
MLSMHASSLVSQLNADQKNVFDVITERVPSGSAGFFFVCGHGGTVKTFLWNAIIARLRSEKKIVLAVASSGVASLLLPRGRTAHSRFKIPFDITEAATCSVKRGTMLAELIQVAALIIWDEAPMTHRRCFEALDRTMRDILSEHNPANALLPFGGMPVVLGRDFRQILPVVRKGSRSTIVAASITNSKLWQHVVLLKLHTNMRLLNPTLEGNQRDELEQFSKWVSFTRLPEKTFIWSVSFTESTIDSGNVTFQVNAVVGEINDGSATIPATPDGSQASSLMLSGGAGTSIQNTPKKSHALTLSSLPATSEPSLASSATPAKQHFLLLSHPRLLRV